MYLVRCTDWSLYTGVTVDVLHRVEAHNGTHAGGAKYTRSRRPVTLVYVEAAESRSAALRRERAIKGMTRAKKEELILTWRLGPT